MIISQTPYRVSFFGGGTDYPRWYRENGGAVIGTAIDKYCYVSVRNLPPFFEHKHRIVYSNIELVDEVSEIVHPAVNGVLQEWAGKAGLEIHHDGDCPARSGLGSSSSFSVGLINAMAAYHGRMIGRSELMREAIRIEQDVIKEDVGSQDQAWAAFGGTNMIHFETDGRINVKPIIMSDERRQALSSQMMLFFTGISRIASEQAAQTIDNLSSKQANLHEMRSLVDIALKLITDESKSFTELGKLLHEYWKIKKDLTPNVTNPHIDAIYDTALGAGANGGKLLGAGAGGFLLIMADSDKQFEIRNSLSGLTELTFNIDAPGSRIIVYQP
ncbi:MAG: kinase [Rhodospirillaceae bacterium]|nr:kinase [Rhodospirillaceae bacterium]